MCNYVEDAFENQTEHDTGKNKIKKKTKRTKTQ